MNEIGKILNKKEKVIWQGKPKFSAYITQIVIGSIIISAIIGVVLKLFLVSGQLAVIIGLSAFVLFFLFSLWTYSVTHYALTNKRAIFQSGLIGRDFKSVNYDEIKNSSVDVGIIGKIFGVGDINMFTGEMESTGGKNNAIQAKYDTFSFIDSPYDILKLLQKNL